MENRSLDAANSHDRVSSAHDANIREILHREAGLEKIRDEAGEKSTNGLGANQAISKEEVEARVRIELEPFSGRLSPLAKSRAQSRDLKEVEARVRIELTYKGFADLSLTTWVPRPMFHSRNLGRGFV